MRSWGYLAVGLCLIFSGTAIGLWADSVDQDIPNTAEKDPDATISDHVFSFGLAFGLFVVGVILLLGAMEARSWGEDE